MRGQGLDALLVYGQDQMYYLTGYDQIGYAYYQVLIVRVEGDPFTYLCREVDAHIIRETSIVEDIRVWYDDSANDPTELTARCVCESGALAGRRIGIDLQTHALWPHFYARLARHLHEAEIVDASSLLTELRLEKSPAEVEYMKEAGRLFDVGLAAGFDAIRAGVRECDVHAAVMHALYSAGGEFPAVAPPIESGPRTLHQTHGAALRRVLEEGDPFTLEIGACYRRYHAVGVRSIAVGRAADPQRRLHAILDEAIGAGMAVAAPGMRTAALATAMHEVYLRHGIDRRTRHCGYGIGIGYPPTWLDSLRIKLTDPHVLKPGMTFMMHGILADWDRRVAVALGDPVLITERGAELLTRTPRDLVVRA
jgi:Xaa-Pro dipeptidase